MRAVAGHVGLAGLAELWSSFSCGFRYDPARTQLWVKPFLLGRWLTLLHDREYEVRVVGHGVRSGRYDQLAKDPAGFKPESWHEHGNGIYVSTFDAIPADCGRSSTGGGPSARAYPDGTLVLALLLTEPGAAKMGKPPTRTGRRSGSTWAPRGGGTSRTGRAAPRPATSPSTPSS